MTIVIHKGDTVAFALGLGFILGFLLMPLFV